MYVNPLAHVAGVLVGVARVPTGRVCCPWEPEKVERVQVLVCSSAAGITGVVLVGPDVWVPTGRVCCPWELERMVRVKILLFADGVLEA